MSIDTFSFVSQIKNANFSKNFLVSNDVTSFFTNILPQETIDIVINLIFNHNPNLNITKKEHKTFFLVATSQAHFIFNSKFYNQIDGVAMGSALAPALANISCIFTNLSDQINTGFELNIESVPRNSKNRQGVPTMVGCDLGKFWKFDPSRCSKTAFPVHFSLAENILGHLERISQNHYNIHLT